MDHRCFCFGEYDDMNPRCLLKCLDRWACQGEANQRRIERYLKECANGGKNLCYDDIVECVTGIQQL